MPLGPGLQVVALAAAQRRSSAIAFWDSGVTGQQVFANSAGDTVRIINALYSEHPWDTAWMAGYRLPGECAVMNGLTEIGIDMKKPDGKDGGRITVKGYKPGKFEVSCTVSTAEQWDALQAVIEVVWRQKKKKGKLKDVAFDIHHPALALYGVTSCVIEGLSYPQPGKYEGSKVINFKCIENVAPGNKAVTKRVAAGPTIAVQIRKEDPSNATPEKPSAIAKDLGPKGPARAAAHGTS